MQTTARRVVSYARHRVAQSPPVAAWRRRRTVREIEERTHADSWKQPGVAEQMRALSERELEHAEDVPPFRAFLALADRVAAMNLPVPARFLEHGCGVGHYAGLLERRHPKRFAYTGADYAPDMVEIARSTQAHGTFVVDDALRTQLDLDTFDVLCPSGLIEVLPEWRTPLMRFLEAQAPVVFLHRQRLTDGPTRLDVAPGYDGQTTYRLVMSRADLEACLQSSDRTILAEERVSGDVFSLLFVRSGT